MSEDTEGDHHGHEHDDSHDHHDHDESGEWRTTSPMQEFTTSQVWIGLVVLAVGLVVTFGIPLALA